MLGKIAACGLVLAFATFTLAQHANADVLDNQDLPAPGWFNGTGAVNGGFTVDNDVNGIQLALRAELRTVGPVTPVGNVYFVPTGTMTSNFGPVALWNFDFSVNPGTSGLTSSITITNLGNSNVSPLTFDPSAIGDNVHSGAMFQNSENLNFQPTKTILGFDPNQNDEYEIVLSLNNSNGAAEASVTEFIVIGSGVPEPSTWAMMIMGFFAVGFLAYRRKPTLRLAC
jgi:hypothetical protein